MAFLRALTLTWVWIAVSLCPGMIIEKAKAGDPSPDLVKVTCAEPDRYLIKLPIYIADSQAFYKQEGLDVTIKLVGTGGAARQAIATGQTEFAAMAYGGMMKVYEAGKHIQSVAALTKMCPYSLVAIPQVATVRDLKGKRIAVGQLGDETHVIARAILVHSGLDPEKDVGFRQIGGYGTTMLAAMVKGEVEAMLAVGDWKDRLLEQMPANVLVNLVKVQDSVKHLGISSYPVAHVQSSAEYVAKNPEIVQKYVNAVIRSLRWIHSHSSEECIDSVKEKFFPQATRESLLGFMKDIKEAFSPDGMTLREEHDFVRKVFVDAGVIKGEVPFEKVCNRTFVIKANQMLAK